jgi:hypothetical protein
VELERARVRTVYELGGQQELQPLVSFWRR